MDQAGEQVNENIRVTLRGRITLIFFWIRLTVIIAQLIPLIVILALTWKEEASLFLRIFMVIYGVLLLMASGIVIFDRLDPLIHPETGARREESRARQVMNRVEGFFNLAWFISFLGLLIALTGKEGEATRNTAPALWGLAVAIVVLNFVQMLAPLLLLALLFFCLPCLIILVRRLYPEPNRGALQADIDALDQLTWESAKQDYALGQRTIRIEAEDARCTICLQPYQQGEGLRILPCSHHYHQKCADEWFHISGTCPLCVRPIANNVTP